MTDHLLIELDPVSDAPGRFDPDSPEARAVLRAAVERGSATAAPRAASRSRLRVTAYATAGVAAGAVALTAGTLGGGSSALAPEAALAQAVERTAAFTSGRVVWSGSSTGTDGYRVEARNDVRFDGDRVLITSTTDERLPDGSDRLATGDYLQVGKRQWLRAPGGDWREQPATDTPGDFPERIRAEVGDDRLVALVRAASDVRREADGAYRGTLEPEDLVRLARESARGSSLAGGVPLAAPGAPADVTVRLDDEGRVSKLTVRSDRFERTVEYLDLGVPQEIAVPR